MRKVLLGLNFTLFFLCSGSKAELLDPDIFRYLSGKVEFSSKPNEHFFGLVQLVSQRLNKSYEAISPRKSGNFLVKGIVKALNLEKTFEAEHNLALFLKTLSRTEGDSAHHGAECFFCEKNCRFVIENQLAIANLVRLIGVKSENLGEKIFKWVFFICALPSTFFGLTILKKQFLGSGSQDGGEEGVDGRSCSGSRDVEALEKRCNELEGRLSNLQGKCQETASKVLAVDVSAVAEKIAILEGKLGLLDGFCTTTRTQLGREMKQKVTQSVSVVRLELDRLKQNFEFEQRKVTMGLENLEALKASFEALDEQISQIQAKVSSVL